MCCDLATPPEIGEAGETDTATLQGRGEFIKLSIGDCGGEKVVDQEQSELVV